jgi:hypothetical protein
LLVNFLAALLLLHEKEIREAPMGGSDKVGIEVRDISVK